MPSDIGYALPPSNQRPQLFSRVEATESRELLKAKEETELQRSGVELKKTQVVTETREVLDQKFPTEGNVERFRGNTEGRTLNILGAGESIARLPSRVQPFSSFTAQSNRISSFNVAEAAAQGVISPNSQTKPNEPIAPESPSINGSGEISARFEEIAERIQLQNQDEFTQLRPGGESSERVAEERVQDRNEREFSEDRQRITRQNQELVRVFRNQEQALQDEQVSTRQAEQNVAEQRNVEDIQQSQNTQQNSIEQQNDGEENVQSAQTREPGEPTNSSGEPLSSEEQREVQRLAKRDREVRAHEQAHARAGGSNVRGGVQLSYDTGPDGKRYAVDGEVSIDLSTARTPEQTAAKMRQVQSAALAPANPSSADRAVASAASRRELDARAQIAEESRENRQEIGKQGSGAPASVAREGERAGTVEQRESADHMAGAQAVIPNPDFSPQSSGLGQQSLEYAYSSGYALSSPPDTSRPVIAPTTSADIKEPPKKSVSPRSEGESPRQAEVASLAFDRGWNG